MQKKRLVELRTFLRRTHRKAGDGLGHRCDRGWVRKAGNGWSSGRCL
jgi:hypothetical protein